jgi:hypothetical protein
MRLTIESSYQAFALKARKGGRHYTKGLPYRLKGCMPFRQLQKGRGQRKGRGIMHISTHFEKAVKQFSFQLKANRLPAPANSLPAGADGLPSPTCLQWRRATQEMSGVMDAKISRSANIVSDWSTAIHHQESTWTAEKPP